MPVYNRDVRKFVSPEFITGDGAREFAGVYSANFKLKKVLLVTDVNVSKSPWISQITGSLSDNNIDYEIFSAITENPGSDEVMDGAGAFTAGECDGIVAVGGGSVIDCAKGIGIVAENGSHILDYTGIDMIRNPMPPFICIPSTAGSSADVSQYAVISNRKHRTKNLIISKSLIPDLSLIDPVTLTTLPEEIARNSAMDAMIHAIEGSCSNGASPVTDTFGLDSVGLITDNVNPSYWKDPDMAYALMLASLYAGLCFSNAGLGLIHSMAHALGGWTDMNHGFASFIVASGVIKFNMPAEPEKYHRIAIELTKNESNIPADLAIPEIISQRLLEIFGFDEKPSLSDVGIRKDDINEIVQRTMNDPCISTNPRIPEKKDVENILLGLL